MSKASRRCAATATTTPPSSSSRARVRRRRRYLRLRATRRREGAPRAGRHAGHYAYVSSISASGTWPGEVARDDDEGPPCASDAGPDDGDYGVLKAGCERAVREVFGDRSTIARAGLHPRTARERRPAHLVAQPDGSWRRGPRTGRSRQGDATDRRTRPGVVPPRLDRGATPPAPTTCRHRPATRRWAAGSTTPRGPPVRRPAHLGRRRLPARQRGRALDRAAAVDALRGRAATTCGTPTRAAPRGPA